MSSFMARIKLSVVTFDIENIHFDTDICINVVVVVVLLFNVHGKHLRSCRDGQLT